MTPLRLTPDDLQARILYRDGHMIIIDKPSGIPVHKGPKGGETLEDHLGALTFGLPKPPALAHRLDRETSGCLVLGRHRQATARLGDLFAKGKVKKTYWAVTKGVPAQETGSITARLSKRDAKRGWFMKIDPEHGQEALTDYRVLATADGMSLIECEPQTGRTHQIRIHLASLGCPILGDRIYGSSPPPPAGPLLHLHARQVVVPYDPKKPPICAIAPLPPHIEGTFSALAFPVGETMHAEI